MKTSFNVEYPHYIKDMVSYTYNSRINRYHRMGIVSGSDYLVWFYQVENYPNIRLFIMTEKERQDRNWFLPFIIEGNPLYIRVNS